MSDWNPTLYKQFEDERTRPARDLLAQVGPAPRRRVVDLGCGPGNSTELLAARWPEAEVLGIDTSEAMLVDARKRLPRARFERGDIAQWQPSGEAPDLLYANASLQGVPDHAALLPRLFEALAPGGVLAVQMPDNLDEPSHRSMREVASLDPFKATIGDANAVRTRLLSLQGYYDLLAPNAARIDVWRTAYQHPMRDANAIVDWLRSTGLRPFVDALPEALQPRFLDTYRDRIDAAYPARADGRRLLAFPRLFIVAERA